ncbi:MAG: metallophosphoesterase [Bacteroidota bacterium]
MLIKKSNWILLFLLSNSYLLVSQQITRGPYLQQPTTTSIVVRWRTNVPTETKINFGTSINSKTNSASNAEVTTEHILKINNLQADTKYFYEIIPNVDFAALNFNHFFITAPKKDSKRAMHFWAGGDFGDLSNFVYETNQANVRDSYVEYSKGFNTDMWLWLGDNGYGGNRDDLLQKAIFDFYGPKILTKIPFSATLGNHEFDEDPVNQQKTRDVHLLKVTSPPSNGEAGGIASNTKAYYSFDYGNTHFICLDSYGMDEGIYRVYDTNSSQYQWLIKDLTANKSMWTVVFFHHPPYTKRAHDSDTEEELRLIRQTLVPVFDKYKVDLVLNGHSHIYERSYLMQDHLGTSQFFDPSYQIVDKSSGKYLRNEPPFINKSNGTVYVVSGTFGRLEPVLALRLNDPPHPSSYFADLLTGGSLALKIEDNRLDCEWLCADGVVRDRFTMLKNVNKTTKINLEYGEKVKLKASWPGTYLWSDSTKKLSEIEVNPLENTTFTVKDSLGFLQDRFEIVVAPQPVAETQLNQNESICTGKTISGSLKLSNTIYEKWKFTFQLSDEKGSFDKPTYFQELSSGNFNFKMPDNLAESNLYRIRIVPNSSLFVIKPSEYFKVSKPAFGKFLNASVLPFSEEVTLKLSFTGSFPIDYKLNFQTIATTNQAEVEIKVRQFESKNYILESIKNSCGVGSISNEKITITAPLSAELEAFGIKIYPNPVEEELIIMIESPVNKVGIVTNSIGKIVAEQRLQKGKNVVNLKTVSKGIYFLEFELKGKKILYKFLKL